jgi:hypothetical protein
MTSQGLRVRLLTVDRIDRRYISRLKHPYLKFPSASPTTFQYTLFGFQPASVKRQRGKSTNSVRYVLLYHTVGAWCSGQKELLTTHRVSVLVQRSRRPVPVGLHVECVPHSLADGSAVLSLVLGCWLLGIN